MTCVVGIEGKGKVYIGSDSLSSSDYDIRHLKEHKVFKNEDYLIGFCGNPRSGQIIGPKYLPHPEEPIEEFIYQIQKQLTDYNLVINDPEIATTSLINFLIGHNGSLYQIDNDFFIAKFKENYSAIGSGSSFALGSLYETSKLKLSPEKRIRKAIKCASYFCSSVGGKIVIKSTDDME